MTYHKPSIGIKNRVLLTVSAVLVIDIDYQLLLKYVVSSSSIYASQILIVANFIIV